MCISGFLTLTRICSRKEGQSSSHGKKKYSRKQTFLVTILQPELTPETQPMGSFPPPGWIKSAGAQTPLLCPIPALLRLGRAAGLPGAAAPPGGEARLSVPRHKVPAAAAGGGGEAGGAGGRRAQRGAARGGAGGGRAAPRSCPFVCGQTLVAGRGLRRCPGTCRGPGGHSRLAAGRPGAMGDPSAAGAIPLLLLLPLLLSAAPADAASGE